MSKINWFKRSDDPKDMLCVGERVGYSLTNTGIAFSYILILGFISFYYTDIIGVSAGVVGTIMLISRVFDGITDLLMGWMVDRTHTKMGKAKPWILIVAIPNAIACVLAFAVPAAWVGMKQYIYIFVTYNLLNSITFTMLNVPILAANCLITDNQDEHAKSGIWMQIGGTAAMLLVQYTAVSLVAKLGDSPKAWTIAIAIYAFIGAALMIIGALAVRERVVPPVEENRVPFGRRVKALFKNKYWVLYTLVFMLITITEQGTGSGALYYAQYILGNADTYATFSTVQTIVQAIALLVGMTFVQKKLGNVSCTILSFVFFIAAFVMQFFSTAWAVVIISSVFKGLAYALFLAAQGAMIADACNYGSKQAGFDISGIGNAGVTFGWKFGAGIGMAIMGWTLQLFGYDGTLAVQSASGIMGIKFVYLVIPALLSIACILLLLPYDLYKKQRAGEAEI